MKKDLNAEGCKCVK